MFPFLGCQPSSIARDARGRILDVLRRATDGPYASEAELSSFLTLATDLAEVVPQELLGDLLRFRQYGNQDGAFLIRNFPFDHETIGPTPKHWKEIGERLSFQTELITAGVAAVLGSVFAYSFWQNGRLIQNVVPVLSDQGRQKGTGWGVVLDWHIEDAFSEYRADLLVLVCLRGDANAATTVSSFRRISLSSGAEATLRQPQFTIDFGETASESLGSVPQQTVAVISGHESDPHIRFDPIFTRAADFNSKAELALAELRDAVHQAGRQVTLEPGDVLIIDNGRAAHGRTNYVPRYDGTDRWLQRALVTLDLRKPWRRAGHLARVVQADI
jgi:hypothetical protein